MQKRRKALLQLVFYGAKGMADPGENGRIKSVFQPGPENPFLNPSVFLLFTSFHGEKGENQMDSFLFRISMVFRRLSSVLIFS